MNRRLHFLGILIVLAVLVSGCTPAAAPTPTTVPPAPQATQAPSAAQPTKALEAQPTPAPSAAQPSGTPIKVGVINPLTGVYANMGQETTRGARLAAKQINATGGLLGRPVELIERDDKQNTAEGAKQADLLIANEKVDMITGCRSGSVTLAINEVTKRAEVLYFSECQTNHLNDGNRDFGPYTFHFDTTLYWQNQAVLPWVTENLGKKIFILIADYAWGHDNRDSAEKWLSANGIQPVGSAKFPVGTSDFSPIIPQIRAANPDVLYAAAAGADLVALLKQAKSFGLYNEMKIFTPIMDMAFDRELGFENLDPNLYGACVFYWERQDEDPAVKAYVDLYSKEYNAPPGAYSAQQYAAVMAWAEGVKKAGSLDKDKVKAAVEGMTLNHAVGESFVRQCDHQWFMPLVIGRGRTADEAKNVKPWPEQAYREVVHVIEPNEKYERTCQELGHK